MRRRPPLVGGLSDVDINDERVQEAARFASTALTGQANGVAVELSRVLEAKQQVVSGMMYHLKIEVGVASANGRQPQKTRCTVKVVDQPWTSPRHRLHEYQCEGLISNVSRA